MKFKEFFFFSLSFFVKMACGIEIKKLSRVHYLFVPYFGKLAKQRILCEMEDSAEMLYYKRILKWNEVVFG